MYNRQEVYEATLNYFNGDTLAANVWTDKYCLKNNTEYHELTPDDMHRRLAREFARIESKYANPMSEDTIYNLLKGFKYVIPQGSPMAGIGNPFALTSISNCFVIGHHADSYGGIMKADQEQAQLMKRRGGVGQDISWIRPSGSIAGTTPLGPNAGTTLYMERFSNTTREVQQDGRRGALMLSIDMKHPDAESFIDKKMTPGAVTGANVSVRISNAFMNALENGDDFYQTFPIENSIEEIQSKEQAETLPEYNVLHEGKVVNGQKTYWKRVSPADIWKKIIHNAWSSAEPGILFWDKILFESPARGYGALMKEVSTNPCGEIPLPPNDSCRLLVVNLLSYAYKAFTDEAQLDDALLVDHIKKAQRLMDDVIDLELEKIDAIIDSISSKKWPTEFQKTELELWKKIRYTAYAGRRTGLGITAEGDLIAALGYKYGTPEATAFSEKLHQLIATASYDSSITLAEERGAFPMWDIEKDAESDFIQRMFDLDNNEIMHISILKRYEVFGRRNIGNLTIAPTGSVSILTQTASGIEPVFSIVGFRKKKVVGDERVDFVDEVGDEWTEFRTFHRPFIYWFAAQSKCDINIAEYTLDNMEKEKLEELIKVSPWYEATAQDVDYVEKVRMQGAVQKWVDHSISVTVNMPEHVTEDIVAAVYLEAYKAGCKGVTVYRNNSRGNVLSTESVRGVDVTEAFDYQPAHKRPESVNCDIYFKSARKEPWIILIGTINFKPYEVFAIPHNEATHIPKSNTHGSIVKAGKSRYDLLDEDGEILIEDVTSFMIETEQNETRSISALLRHRVDPQWIVNSIVEKYATINSFHKVIGKVLRSYIATETGGTPCPVCEDGNMIMTEGCMKCDTCGHAHCG